MFIKIDILLDFCWLPLLLLLLLQCVLLHSLRYFELQMKRKKKHLLLPLVSIFLELNKNKRIKNVCVIFVGIFPPVFLLTLASFIIISLLFRLLCGHSEFSPCLSSPKKIKKQTPEDACSSAQLIFFFFILPQTPFVLIHLPTSLKHSLRYLYKRHFVATSC